ncbi:conjugal transfer protein TraH [Yoonia sp. SS1-5]|uniref:Conjugal transfer protein TraH n=1 Tax=Yoonia rhodophyticola TaxID=3137370 RepID=A0AAN0M6P2_9RHOB
MIKALPVFLETSAIALRVQPQGKAATKRSIFNWKSLRALKYLSAAAIIATATPSKADMASDLLDFWNRSGGGANVTHPSAYQGQRAGYISLGSLYVRTQPRNSQIANIQLPSVRSGCGGIDIFAGSFSYLSAQELIAMMEAIMANAAGFAFELALESLSPAVQEVVGKLRDLAQQVNSMNINSCETGQLLVSSIWPKTDAASQHICQSIATASGLVADRARARHGCGTGGDHASTLANGATPDIDAQIPVDVNYAWKASRKNSFLVADDDLAEFFMTVTGTIIVVGAPDDDTPRTHVNYPPRAFSSEMIRTMVEGGTMEVLRCNSDPQDRCLNPSYTTITLPANQALYARVSEILEGINTALANDTALPAAAPGLIGMTSVPVYEILKTARSYKYEFVGDEIALMAELVAIDFAMLYTREALEEMLKLASNTEGLGDQISDYRKQVTDSYANFTAMRREAAERFADAVATLTRLMSIKSALSGERAGWLATQVVEF